MKKGKKTLDFVELVYILITVSFVCLSFVAIKNEIRFAKDGYIVQGTITFLDWKPLGGHYSGNINDIPIIVEYVNENGEKKITKSFASSRYHILDYVPGKHVDVRVLRSVSGEDSVTYLNDTASNVIAVGFVIFDVFLVYLFFKVYSFRRRK